MGRLLFFMPPISRHEAALTTSGAVGALPSDRDRALKAAVYIAFTFSGAAGLMYESVWSRYLGLLVGHAAYAQVLVLGIYLGGLAVGAAVAAHWSDRLRDPLRAYAIIEIAVGILGLVFHLGFVGVSSIMYDTLLPLMDSTPLRTVSLWLVSAGLIIPQAIMLGGTFPLMAAGVLRRVPGEPGGVLSRLYFTNSIGAAVGVLVAGFGLLAWVGLPGTSMTAGIINLAVGAGVLALARRYPLGAPQTERRAGQTPSAQGGIGLSRLLLGVAFGTAVASFIYEIGWLRMLVLVLGGATHTFEIMLSAFILGLALGALWVRRRSDRWTQPLVVLGVVQCAMGYAAILTLPLYGQSFRWTAALLQTIERTELGYLWFSLAKYGTSLLIMLPATFCAGMILPLVTRTLLVSGAGERAIGSVYAVNTLGAIVGAGTAGIILLPVLGLQNMIIAAAGLDIAIGVVLLYVAPQSRAIGRPLAAVGVAGVVMLLVGTVGRIDQRVLASGVFRFGDLDAALNADVMFYEDGRTATVSVSRRGTLLSIATNGKADGSLPLSWLRSCTPDTPRSPMRIDAGTQMLAPMIALAHAPAPRRVAVIGQGTGISSHLMLGPPDVEQVTTIEIEPQMIMGSWRFYPFNQRVFDDPRSRFAIEDARTFFSAVDDKFDVILSEPSNPWMSGVASLFTVEFYRHVLPSLTEDGVFAQWIQLYETEDDLLLSVLAALHEVFPSYALFQTSSADLLIVASKSESLEADWSVFDFDAFDEDFCRVHPIDPVDLEVLRIADRRAFEALFRGPQPVNSDFHPVLDLGAERARFLRKGAQGFLDLGSVRFSVLAMLSERILDVPVEPVAAVTDVPRAIVLSQSAGIRAAGPWWTPEGLSGGDDGSPGMVLRAGLEMAGGLGGVVARDAAWRYQLQRGSPPEDWRAWVQEFRAIELERSVGAVGRAEKGFFSVVEAYLSRTNPPSLVRYIVLHHRALALSDIAAVASYTDSILASADYPDWIEPSFLLEVGVTSNWMLGKHDAALRVWNLLSERYQRSEGDVRRSIVEALAHGEK